VRTNSDEATTRLEFVMGYRIYALTDESSRVCVPTINEGSRKKFKDGVLGARCDVVVFLQAHAGLNRSHVKERGKLALLRNVCSDKHDDLRLVW
jgi:hypothetical protein